MLRPKFNKVKMNIDFIIFWDSSMSRMKNVTDMPEDLAASLSVGGLSKVRYPLH
jgi:hypothetical protein